MFLAGDVSADIAATQPTPTMAASIDREEFAVLQVFLSCKAPAVDAVGISWAFLPWPFPYSLLVRGPQTLQIDETDKRFAQLLAGVRKTKLGNPDR